MNEHPTIAQILTDYWKQLGERIASGEVSPYSRLEILVVGAFAAYAAKRLGEKKT